MDEQETAAQRRLLALSRYIIAMEQGDSATIIEVLQQAEQDAVLEQMLLELNLVYQEIDQTGLSEHEQQLYTRLLPDLPPVRGEQEHNLIQQNHHSILPLTGQLEALHIRQVGSRTQPPTRAGLRHSGRNESERLSRKKNWLQTLAAVLVACLLISGSLFLVLRLQAISSQNSGNTTVTKTVTVAPTHTLSPLPTRVPPTVPASVALTTCPAPGTARAAVMTPMALGKDSTLIYTVNEGGSTAPTFGTLKRYDVVTGTRVEIIKQAHTWISEAQVSADGQWGLFVALIAGRPELQLVRMDGQELQTLYCGIPTDGKADPTSVIEHVQWSTDQQSIIFDNGGTTIFLLQLASGHLETLFTAPQGHFIPRTWLNKTQIFLSYSAPRSSPSRLYLLDINRGANQTENNLSVVYRDNSANPCWDFDTSYDSMQLFTSLCTYVASTQHTGPTAIQGPTSISMQNASGGTEKTLYSNAKFAIITVRAVSPTTLLFLVSNRTFEQNGTIDSSSNGLWRINKDGSGLMRLTSDPVASTSSLNLYTQYPWSNLSRNGELYILSQTAGNTSSLLIGSLTGGTPLAFASISDGTQLNIAGWTTM
ncbi:MAG TPA: hypothetical protein VFN35_22115 [Ktedonobacteraceae bacterium]|nr:hypothetical protein [Ktedonobacteraceae bacterium]